MIIKKQKGIVLILSSVILVSVLFLTIASVNSTINKRRAIASYQSMQQATLAAEAALKDAEQAIEDNAYSESQFDEGCSEGLCQTESNKGIWRSQDKWTTAKSAASKLKTKSKLIENPKYIIEYVGTRKKSDSMSLGKVYGESEDFTSSPIYRITTKAKGKHGKKEAVIQSTYH